MAHSYPWCDSVPPEFDPQVGNPPRTVEGDEKGAKIGALGKFERGGFLSRKKEIHA